MHRGPAIFVAALLGVGFAIPSAADAAVPASRVYWTDANWWNTATAEVGRVNADGSDWTILVPAANGPSGVQRTGYVAVDPQQAYVYWADSYPTPSIKRARLDGSAPETVVVGGEPFGVAVAAGHVYWTDYADMTIKRARLDGSATRTLVRGLGRPDSYIASPHDLAVDPVRGKLYWTATDLHAVQRANLDGSNVETIATSQYPMGIGLDLVAGRVYWVSGGCIHRVRMTAGAPERVICPENDVTDVAVDHGAGLVYWTEMNDATKTGQIRRAHLDGTSPELVVAAGLGYPWGLALAPGAALPSDFDGDGFADLAVGVPGEGVDGHAGAGAVNVLYGSRTGLTAARDQYWTLDTAGLKGSSDEGAQLGRAIASGDFDGDGYADLAVGSADRSADGTRGAVHVLRGSPAGLTARGDQRWSPATVMPGLETLGNFGSAMTAADFDGDGYADLAIGAGQASWGFYSGQGAVAVLRGGPTGLGAAGSTVLDVRLLGLPDGYDYYFGSALAAGDLDGDGCADLAVGAPGTSFLGYDSGLVGIFHGSVTGISTSDVQAWSQASPGIEGGRVAYERFGAILAVGDFDGDAYGDLAIGVPDERFATSDPRGYAGDDRGAVNVLYGSPGGLSSERSRLWHQDSPGVPGIPASGDEFGHSLAAGDLDGDGRDDLAIGNPGERVAGIPAGAVTVLYGGTGGLGSVGAQRWTQATAGVPGTAEARDAFGDSVAIGGYGRSSADDLAIGDPREAIGRRGSDGLVTVLYGQSPVLGTTGAQQWWQGSPGVLGTPENPDRFGSSLTP